MKSFVLQCSLAALVGFGISASLSMAQDVPARPGIAAQISALGLDQAAVKANLEGLSRDARITYLQSLGVRLPEGVARPVTRAPLADGVTLQAAPQVTTVRLENASTLAPGTFPEGEMTIQPWPLPGNGNTGVAPDKLGDAISSDGKIIDARPGVGGMGPAMTMPARPAATK